MGGCAGCMGPSRRDQNYRVNRLTQNAIIKSRVTIQLPVNRQQKKIVEQLNQQKRRLDQSSLLGLLASSPQINSTFNKQSKYSPQIYRQTPNQPLFMKQNYQSSSLILPKSIRRVQSSLINENFIANNNSIHFSHEKFIPAENRSALVSEFKIGNFSRQTNKKPLSQVVSNKNSNEVNLQLKRISLLGIPQISEEQSKTPHYTQEEKRKNGEDVLKTNLAAIPTRLENAPCANLFKYLQDFI